MLHYCLEFPHGAVKHFPAGTYDAQVDTYWGRSELQLMDQVFSVWRAFSYVPMRQWGENERRLAAFMMPKPKTEKPTKRLNFLIRRLWPYSFFAMKVLLGMQKDGKHD